MAGVKRNWEDRGDSAVEFSSRRQGGIYRELTVAGTVLGLIGWWADHRAA
jgi:hypothetical protein